MITSNLNNTTKIIVDRLNDLRLKILRLFGSTIGEIYQISAKGGLTNVCISSYTV